MPNREGVCIVRGALTVLSAGVAAALVAGCGGGGGGGSTSTVSTTPTYSISGTVTGMFPGSSVVLYNNGTDAKTVTADASGAGSFTFSTALAVGTAYAVTVTTPPAQTCTVTVFAAETYDLFQSKPAPG